MGKIIKCTFKNIKPNTLDGMLMRMPKRYKCESKCKSSGEALVVVSKENNENCDNYDLQVVKDVLYMVNSECVIEDYFAVNDCIDKDK